MKRPADSSAGLLPLRDPMDRIALGYAYGRSGDKGRAYQLISKLRKIPQQRYVSSYDLALIYVGLGENDKALESLEAAYVERSSWMIFLMVTPEFDGLRADPRFMRLLHRMGLSVRPGKSKSFLSRGATPTSARNPRPAQ